MKYLFILLLICSIAMVSITASDEVFNESVQIGYDGIEKKMEKGCSFFSLPLPYLWKKLSHGSKLKCLKESSRNLLP